MRETICIIGAPPPSPVASHPPNWNYGNPYKRNPVAGTVVVHALAHAPVVAYPASNRLTIRCDATNCVCPFRIMADTMATPSPLFPLIDAAPASHRNPFADSRAKVAVWPGRPFFSSPASMSVNEVDHFSRKDCCLSSDYYAEIWQQMRCQYKHASNTKSANLINPAQLAGSTFLLHIQRAMINECKFF